MITFEGDTPAAAATAAINASLTPPVLLLNAARVALRVKTAWIFFV
jgi:hypothetical protein